MFHINVRASDPFQQLSNRSKTLQNFPNAYLKTALAHVREKHENRKSRRSS